jgi:hypothetical protein
MAGRLRTRWVHIHTHEVFFRDTAHGFLAWSTSLVLTAGLLTSAASMMAGVGIPASTFTNANIAAERVYSASVDNGQAEARTTVAAQLEERRRAIAHSLYWTFVALLMGAFCASVAATIGGKERDRMAIA